MILPQTTKLLESLNHLQEVVTECLTSLPPISEEVDTLLEDAKVRICRSSSFPIILRLF